MQTICGVDVSRAWLDAWIEPVGHRRFGNTPEGVGALAGWVEEHGGELVVMEASGGIEQPAFVALWQAGCPGAIADPKAVRRFCQAMGALEKTDRIDAELIARFAAARRLKPMAPPSADQRKLDAIAARMRQVTADLAVHKQRRHSAYDEEALASLDEAIAFLKAQAKALSGRIAAMIQADPLWSALDQSLRSVKGVADRSVAILLTELGEIGIVSDKAIAKLAGLAPLANDSGKHTGQRHIRGGRAGVRSLLFLIADVARKYDPDLDAFRQRLLAKGKPKMVVRTALARKLLVRLNAKARQTRASLAQSLGQIT